MRFMGLREKQQTWGSICLEESVGQQLDVAKKSINLHNPSAKNAMKKILFLLLFANVPWVTSAKSAEDAIAALERRNVILRAKKS